MSERLKSKHEKCGHSKQQRYMGHSNSTCQISSICCCHIDNVATNGLIKKNQKHNNPHISNFQMWIQPGSQLTVRLETYAAFLSSDLITRLFSRKANGVGLSWSHVLSRTPRGGKSLINCPVCMVSVNRGLHRCPVNSYWMQNIVGATQSTIYSVQQMDKFANVKKNKNSRDRER